MESISEIIKQLQDTISARKNADPQESYTAQLLKQGTNLICKKIGEESAEVIIAAKDKDRHAVVYESADLIFHLMVLWAEQGILSEEIFLELRRRFALSGLAEKAQRK